MLSEPVGPPGAKSTGDADDGDVQHAEGGFTARGQAPANGLAGAVAIVLATDKIAAINAQALGDMEARISCNLACLRLLYLGTL
jgi:hypothetical protein